MANLSGKVGIVTGGGTGIGRATALAMAKAGATVLIGNRDEFRDRAAKFTSREPSQMAGVRGPAASSCSSGASTPANGAS